MGKAQMDARRAQSHGRPLRLRLGRRRQPPRSRYIGGVPGHVNAAPLAAARSILKALLGWL